MARGTIFGIYAHIMIKGGLSKITQTYEVISNQCFQWRSIFVLLANNSHGLLKPIIPDYATLTAPRDPIFGMYTQKTTRNHIRYINLNLMVIRGQQRPIEFNRCHQGSQINNNTQGQHFLHVYSNVHQKLYQVCKIDHQDLQRSQEVI